MSRWRETPPPAQVQPMSAPSRLECRRLDRRLDKSRAGRASTVTGILAQIHRLSAEAGHQCSDDANERRPRLARCSRRFGAASIVLVNSFDALRHLECGDTDRRGVREQPASAEPGHDDSAGTLLRHPWQAADRGQGPGERSRGLFPRWPDRGARVTSSDHLVGGPVLTKLAGVRSVDAGTMPTLPPEAPRSPSGKR